MSVELEGLDAILDGLDAFAEGLLQNAKGAAQEIADVLEAYAKANHPWKNDSGDTEASIMAQMLDDTEDLIIIALSAGMPYDVFLELAHDGKWAWLFPAIVANESKILSILKRRLGNGRLETS